MGIQELELENFENLEDFCRYVEERVKTDGGKELDRLRWRIFDRWHREYGFTDEDEDFVKACRFDIDMFETEAEQECRDSRLQEGIREYRTERDKYDTEMESRAAESYGNLRKNRKLKKRELRKALEEQYQKEQELAACLYRADKSLKRKGCDRCAEMLVQEVYAGGFAAGYTREELCRKADEYIECGGSSAKQVLKITSEEFLRKTDAYVKRNRKGIIAWGMLGITALNLLLLLARYAICIVKLERVVLCIRIPYIFLSLIVSAAAWVYTTTQEYFNFQNRKWRALMLVIANDAATILQLPYTVVWDILIVRVFKIQVNTLLTPAMVLNLGRVLEAGAMAVGIFAVYKLVKPFVMADEAKEKILAFKLKHIIDTRENKEFQYDFNVLRDLATGKKITVKEKDLSMHTLLQGSSGTGKTSSIFIPQIIENIRKKQKNLEMQQKEVLKMVQAGDVKIKEPFTNNKFGKQYFTVVNERAKRKFEKIFTTYRECGITVVAPNNSMNEDILAYTSGRGIWINNLDPTKKKATHPYERLVGLNPFYVSPKFHDIAPGDRNAEEERTIHIAEAANNFADALTAINELNGSGDQYFTDVNTTVTSAVSTVLMLDASIKDTQVTIDDVYNSIVNYDLLKPVVANIKRHFNIKYESSTEEPGKRGRMVDNRQKHETLRGMEDQQLTEEQEEEMQRKIYDQLSEEDRKNPYIQTIITVESRLQKGSKMDEHAEGLRNLIGKLLQDPRVKRVLVNNRDIIDFNEILAGNAITVVNTALEFGKNTSTCFGQLFLLNFNSAVLRRPKNLRTPHFFYEDETARYLSDTIDTMVTLYRQYNVPCMFALQSLEQVEKVPALAYLRNTLLSAGTIITFGRANYTDSEAISNLGGQKRYDVVQHTRSYTAMLSENSSSSFSDRTTPDKKNYLEPHDVRYRDFQECTIITTDEGHVLPARLAKANFVPEEILHGQDQGQIDHNNAWSMVWANRYPLVEDVMPVSAETTISPKSSLDTAKVLREKSGQSVTVFSGRDEVAAANRISRREPETLRALLNAGGTKTDAAEEADAEDGVMFDDMEPGGDEEWGFCEDPPEETFGAGTEGFSRDIRAEVSEDFGSGNEYRKYMKEETERIKSKGES